MLECHPFGKCDLFSAAQIQLVGGSAADTAAAVVGLLSGYSGCHAGRLLVG